MQTRLTHVEPRVALVDLVVDMDLCRTFSAVDLLRARSTGTSAAGLQLQNLYRRSRGTTVIRFSPSKDDKLQSQLLLSHVFQCY